MEDTDVINCAQPLIGPASRRSAGADPTGLRDCDYADCGSGGESKDDITGDGKSDAPRPGGGQVGGGRWQPSNNGALGRRQQ